MTAQFDHPGLRLRHGIDRCGQISVQFEESLFGDRGQQLGLIGEVPVRGRGADPGAPCRLGQGEPFRSFLGHER